MIEWMFLNTVSLLYIYNVINIVLHFFQWQVVTHTLEPIRWYTWTTISVIMAELTPAFVCDPSFKPASKEKWGKKHIRCELCTASRMFEAGWLKLINVRVHEKSLVSRGFTVGHSKRKESASTLYEARSSSQADWWYSFWPVNMCSLWFPPLNRNEYQKCRAIAIDVRLWFSLRWLFVHAAINSSIVDSVSSTAHVTPTKSSSGYEVTSLFGILAMSWESRSCALILVVSTAKRWGTGWVECYWYE